MAEIHWQDKLLEAEKIGYRRGWKRGYQRAWKRGARKKALEVAEKLLAADMDALKISEFVGLPLDGINALAK